MTGTHPKHLARLRRRLRSDRRSARATQRRGILLLVVLSMLVLFMLMGTTFLITSSQYKEASKAIEKAGRSTFQPEDVLERALMQLVRDTNNRHSVARYHSLLRDLYGADGFVGQVHIPNNPTNDAQSPHYAGANSTLSKDIGTTQGQFVDFYVHDDPTLGPLDGKALVGLDFDDDGLPTTHDLAAIDGYYNGSLLTMLAGPCRGQSVRVIDYDYDEAISASSGIPSGRFRVMAPQRADGKPLAFQGTTSVLADFIEGDQTGHRFMVNGRPYNGTGVGFNAFASPNSPQLTALEAVQDVTSGEWIGLEYALMPNATMFDPTSAGYLNPTSSDPFKPGLTVADFRELNPSAVGSTELYPFFHGPGGADESYDAADFQNMFLALQSPEPRVRGRVVASNGGSINSVDPDRYYANDQGRTAPERLDLEGVTIPSFHRPALINFWLHRQVKRLTNWGMSAQDAALAVLLPYGPDMLRDTSDDPSIPLAERDLIVSIKRKAMLRPLSEDHPGFDGSNALSRYDSLSTKVDPAQAELVNLHSAGTPNDDEVTFPYWEAVGPWDVDNDRDGAPDSIWIDLGLPIQTTEDGRRYKPLVAMLVEDLDGRLNLNAHGSTEHLANDGDFLPGGNLDNDDLDVSILIPDPFNPPDINSLAPADIFGANLAQDYDNSPFLFSSNQLPHGSGWGPADISLRPILSPDLPLYDFQNGASLTASAQYDDYARLLVGRPDPTDASRLVSDAVKVAVTFGRYGSFPGSDSGGPRLYAPGRTLNTFNPLAIAHSREERVPFDFPGYPLFAGDSLSQSGFGQRPDIFSRYGTGLGPSGAPVRESVADGWLQVAPGGVLRPILDDSPYELNLSDSARRRPVADLDVVKNSYVPEDPADVDYSQDRLVDDAPFSPAELERLLRAFDFDADKLPDRLWNLVDAFDPQKLAVQDAIIRGDIPDPDDMTDGGGLWNPNSLERVIAQGKAAINRRQVTTESFDLPVPNENWTARLLLGADGLPGVAFDDPSTTGVNEADDDNDGIVNEGEGEIGSGIFDPTDGVDFNDSDDYFVVMDKLPRPSARLADYMEYRITLELYRQKVIVKTPVPTPPNQIARLVSEILFGSNDRDATYVRSRDTVGTTADAGVQTLPALMSYGGLLAPEVLAGLKMDLNRPFGDGRDNNGNGVVDEPQEAGEPWMDLDGDGVWETGEPYLDLDKDGRFYADANDDGIFFGDAAIDNNDDWFDLDGDGVEEPLVDSVWTQAPGGPYPMDYVRGVDANGRGAYVDSDGNAFHDRLTEPRVHDDGQMARQLYARHLYCLMLAVMDENYLAPFDESDPQVLHYIDSRSGRLESGNPVNGSGVAYRLVLELHAKEFATEITAGTVTTDPNISLGATTDPLENRRLLTHAEARRLAIKKLTRRQIAQWAINTVDMRDPDAIQTPFEYDENPWDGWNVADTVSGEVFPLDGDIATDENHAYIRLISNDDVGDGSGVVGWRKDAFDSDGDKDVEERVLRVSLAAPIALTLQTRGVVWGAERPELLMTEGLALHDRRLSDEALALVEGPSDNPSKPTELDLGREIDGDDDLDQLFKPQGSAFLELYNPWSADDQKPTELYSRQTELTGPAKVLYKPAPDTYRLLAGVALDRLSNGVAERRDPARALEANKVMQIRGADGFRKRPNTGGGASSSTPITLAASPVWRVICVEEHPDVRNNVSVDNPMNPAGNSPRDDSPWNYSKQNGAATDLVLPYAYRRVAALLTPPSFGGPPSDKVFLQADPDWPSFDRFARPGSLLPTGQSTSVPVIISYVLNGINTDTDPNNNPIGPPQPRLQLKKPDRYIERAFYFVGAPEISETAPPFKPLNNNEPFLAQRNLVQPGLVIPDLSYEYSLSSSSDIENQIAVDYEVGSPRMSDANASSLGMEFYGLSATDGMAVSGNRFVATDRFEIASPISSNLSSGRAESQPLAPIMPGRYAVIGPANASYEYKSAGIDLSDSADLVTLANRFTTVLSREHEWTRNLGDWERLRRIELIPSADPNQHQVVIRFNGRIPVVADPSASPSIKAVPRHSEVVEVIEFGSGSKVSINVTELPNPSQPGFLFADPADLLHPKSIQPVVAIPVEGFNISEPLDGYHLRRNELLLNEPQKLRMTPSPQNPGSEAMAIGVTSPTSPFGGFDQPLDVLQELLTDSTIPNYRTLHLQRLANPLLAWNPPPLTPNGDTVTEHDPSRPVNPYLTTDSLPMDLVSYNGAIKKTLTRDEQPLASVERGIEPGTPRIDSNSPHTGWC